ncbi:MAG: 3-dehydroquinate synthase [Campylobacterales bacterium]
MTIPIDLKKECDESYPIIIGELAKLSFNRKVAIITNPKVGGLHLSYLLERLKAQELYVVTVPDGEDHKTLETIASILDRLFEHRLDRKSLLIAFGGGVIGDMTGFAAAIFQRGIEFIQVPTTLLSMVDASVGGKTGINNRFGKNLIGSFNQPKAVYIDPYFLSTLPSREFAAGVAEIIKMAVTFDADFFSWLEENDLGNLANLQEAIAKSVQIKARVVAMDEKEQGVRAVLNYGHTFGHVIENLEGYGRYLHGEAVALGMVMANRLAVRVGLLKESEEERIAALLERYGLPRYYRVVDPANFYEKFFLDKKSHHNKLTFILPHGIGGYKIESGLDQEMLLALLESFSG